MTLIIELNNLTAYMHNAALGVVNRHGQSNSTISSICGPCLGQEEPVFFADISDSLETYTACHDTYILRFAVFLWTIKMMMTTTRWTD